MHNNDELSELWCSQPLPTSPSTEELVKLVQAKTDKFDRQIRFRNLFECIAAAAVTLIFSGMAYRANDPFSRTGFTLTAATGLWIIFFILHYGRASAPPDPGLDLDGYRRALVTNFDRQIWLLKSVKYWYLLPLWVGLVLGNIGGLRYQARHGGLGWFSLLAPAIYTASFAFVWWLNEVKGVGQLRTRRSSLLALAGESSLPDDSR